MALRKLTLQTSASTERVLDLDATPYMIGSGPNVAWMEGVELFHAWLLHNFPVEKVAGTFEVAEKLDVHCCITDQWMDAVDRFTDVKLSVVSLGKYRCSAFVIPRRGAKPDKVRIDVGELRDFDPMTDRSLDDQIDHAGAPLLYIDKYYEAFSNETMIVHRKMRVRPNRRVFEPLEHDDILLRRIGQTPFDEKLFAEIDRLASGDKSTRRVGW